MSDGLIQMPFYTIFPSKALEITNSLREKSFHSFMKFLKLLPTFDKMWDYNCSPSYKVPATVKKCCRFKAKSGETLGMIKLGATTLLRIIQREKQFTLEPDQDWYYHYQIWAGTGSWNYWGDATPGLIQNKKHMVSTAIPQSCQLDTSNQWKKKVID